MTSRRHSLLPAPPPLTWQEQATTLDGAGELLPPVFWSALRSVQLWMETRPESRAALFTERSLARRERFAAATAAEPGIAAALRVFVSVLDAPARAGEDEIATACDEVRAWAEERGHMRLAALFAEWAAYADPESAARANHAGRLCRRTSQTHRAEVWYDRALKLGIRSREPDQQLRAQLGYGNLLRTLGRFEEARTVLIRAARRAGRYNRKRVAAEAHHDLLGLAVYTDSVSRGAKHFQAALMLYPYKHPRLPVLVHDWGVMLLQRRHYTAAVRVLEQVVALNRTDPHLRALCLSTMARAYSAAGHHDKFLSTEAEAVRQSNEFDEFLAAVLDNLAQGWRAQGEWRRAQDLAECAALIAVERGDKIIEHSARTLLAEILNREPNLAEEDLPDHLTTAELLTASSKKLRWWSGIRGASRSPTKQSVPRAPDVSAAR